MEYFTMYFQVPDERVKAKWRCFRIIPANHSHLTLEPRLSGSAFWHHRSGSWFHLQSCIKPTQMFPHWRLFCWWGIFSHILSAFSFLWGSFSLAFKYTPVNHSQQKPSINFLSHRLKPHFYLCPIAPSLFVITNTLFTLLPFVIWLPLPPQALQLLRPRLQSK